VKVWSVGLTVVICPVNEQKSRQLRDYATCLNAQHRETLQRLVDDNQAIIREHMTQSPVRHTADRPASQRGVALTVNVSMGVCFCM
jgi:hypothetical protein